MISQVVNVIRSQFKAPRLLLDLPRVTSVEVTSVQKFAGRIVISLQTLGHDSEIILNLIDDQIIWHDGAYNDLTGEYTIGTDSFETLALGLPSIVATASILAANSLFWKTSNRLFGMSRHALSIWCRLRHQLDHETQNHLLRMLRKI
jgi:hypothetical protein